ncbi:putative 2-aminoethylphosphonate ABC transporter permease subunit [Pseudomonas segetis]
MTAQPHINLQAPAQRNHVVGKNHAGWADRLFIEGGKGLLLVLLVVAVLLPLLAMLWRGFGGDGGGLGAAYELFSSANFRWLLFNSLSVSTTVALIVVPLAYLFAYALQRTLIAGKGVWRAISLLPLMAPSMLPGIALIYLFGNQGILRGLFADNIYGFWGIVLGEVIYTFPHALMILISALSLADARLFDAASSMGASPWRAFRSITWPGSRQGVFAAFCLVFTLTITDFGVPVVVGGDYQVLALEAYKAVVGQQQFGRGALIGMVLLIPALLSFGVDMWLRRRSRDSMSGRAQVYHPQPSRLRDSVFLGIVILVCAALLLVFGMAIFSSLVKFWPYNLSLVLDHYSFSDLPGGWSAYSNSLILATCSAVFGSLLIFTGAYLMEKTRQNTLTQILRMLSFIPMAVPGLVLGLGYVFFFNLPSNPLSGLYGTLTLLVVCTIAHFLTTAQMTASTALRQLDGEFEAAALSLKMPLAKHYLRVTLPICLPALLDIIRYLFVSAMTTVSAAIFLYSPDSMLAAVAVLNMDDAGNVGGAAAMSTLILLTSAGVSVLLATVSRGLLMRSQAWRQADDRNAKPLPAGAASRLAGAA